MSTDISTTLSHMKQSIKFSNSNKFYGFIFAMKFKHYKIILISSSIFINILNIEILLVSLVLFN